MFAVEYDLVARIINSAEREKITVVEGAAGAGKTRRLAATRKQVEARGGRMLVVTPTRKAAQVAAGEVGAETRAVAKLLHEHGFRWDDEGHWSRTEPSPAAPPLDSRTLLVVDEAGMLDQDSARALLSLADASGAQVALIGDRHQLPAVGRGGVLDLAVRYAPERCIEYGGVHRFTDPAYAELSLRMRSGAKPGEVFDELVRRGDVVLHASDVERQDVLAVKASYSQLVVADTREQVARINHVAHRVRVVTGQAADSVVTASGEQIGIGDTIATRQNDAEVDVANREMWTVIDIVGRRAARQGRERAARPATGLRQRARRARLRDHGVRRPGLDGHHLPRPHRRPHRRRVGVRRHDARPRTQRRPPRRRVRRGRPYAVGRGVRARPSGPRAVPCSRTGCRGDRPLRAAGSAAPASSEPPNRGTRLSPSHSERRRPEPLIGLERPGVKPSATLLRPRRGWRLGQRFIVTDSCRRRLERVLSADEAERIHFRLAHRSPGPPDGRLPRGAYRIRQVQLVPQVDQQARRPSNESSAAGGRDERGACTRVVDRRAASDPMCLAFQDRSGRETTT